jgi:hypothetical protein
MAETLELKNLSEPISPAHMIVRKIGIPQALEANRNIFASKSSLGLYRPSTSISCVINYYLPLPTGSLFYGHAFMGEKRGYRKMAFRHYPK